MELRKITERPGYEAWINVDSITKVVISDGIARIILNTGEAVVTNSVDDALSLCDIADYRRGKPRARGIQRKKA